jgi:hypothetical protein
MSELNIFRVNILFYNKCKICKAYLNQFVCRNHVSNVKISHNNRNYQINNQIKLC